MEKYLNRCLDSLIGTEKILPLLEVLVINDGSTDKSSDIAHEYELRTPNSIKVMDKANGNYGSCINLGLKVATGKYVKVLDADDWFDKTGLEKLIEVLAKVDVDLVLTDFNRVNPKGEVIEKIRFSFPKNKILDIECYCCQPEFIAMEMHAVAYRTVMVQENKYHQSEGISYTDVEWIFEPMSYVKTFYCTGIVVYQYLVGREGQTVSPSQMSKSLSHTLKGAYAILNAYSRRFAECGRNMRKYLMAKIMIRMNVLYNKTLFLHYLDARELIVLEDYIKEKNKDIYEATGNLKFYKFLPFYHVRWWRNHGRNSMPEWACVIYKTLLFIKRNIFTISK
jgi:glycosyltransferase involved in cell wall biosynthesis